MFRWLGRILVGLSLVLMLGCAGMWIASQRATYLLRFAKASDANRALRHESVGVWCYKDALAWCKWTDEIWVGTDDWKWARQIVFSEAGLGKRSFRSYSLGKEGCELIPADSVLEALGFHWINVPNDSTCYASPFWLRGSSSFEPDRRHGRLIALPWWFMVLLFSLAPAISFLRWRQRRRIPAGCCRGCGYDLRATPQPTGRGGEMLAVCPECGRSSADVDIKRRP